ncbi:hypothetical protein MKX47_07885 [Solibacillus sp. FSL R7-0668]|uniref:hypothetical protein n=1 Tax=Solibacillus sp. FSL R7-0668 TaxID=2921688 RepID=UPI0030FA949D
MVNLLENVYQLSAVVLLLCAIYYYRHFIKTKRARKLTRFEFSIYVITQIALFVCAGSYILLLLDK